MSSDENFGIFKVQNMFLHYCIGVHPRTIDTWCADGYTGQFGVDMSDSGKYVKGFIAPYV